MFMTGAYFSNDFWHITESTYGEGLTIIAENFVESVRDKAIVESRLKTLTGIDFKLIPRWK